MDSAIQQHYNDSLRGEAGKLAQRARVIKSYLKFCNRISVREQSGLKRYRKTVRKD